MTYYVTHLYCAFFFQTTVWCLANLPPAVHEIIEYHFEDSCCGANFYFCSSKDAARSFKYGESMKNVVLLGNATTRELGFDIKTFTHRASLFVDTSCSEGLQFVKKCFMKMSQSYRWLIFVGDLALITEVLKPSRLEMDSDVTLVRTDVENNVVLTRIDRMYYKMQFSPPFNFWPHDVGKYGSSRNKALAWRNEIVNMKGYVFNATILFVTTKWQQTYDWHLLLNHSIVEPDASNIRRYMAHLVLYMMQMYNFSIYVIPTSTWGPVDIKSNGSFASVMRGDVEFCFSGSNPYAERALYVDFSAPILTSRYLFFLIQPNSFGTPMALVKPFSLGAWVACGLLVIVLTIAMRATILSDKLQLHNDSVGGSMVLVFGGISQTGIPDNATKLSARLTYFVVLTALFLIFLYYSTSVLNGLLLRNPNPIQNIDHLLASETMLAGHDVSYIRMELERNDTATRRARRKAGLFKFYNLKEGFERVQQGRFAFFGLEFPMRSEVRDRMSIEEQCQVTTVQMVKEATLQYFWRKESPFTEFFNRGLLLMWERGIYDYLRKYWFAQQPDCVFTLNFAPIKLQGMALAYGVFAIGLITSLSVALLELRVARRHRRKASSIQKRLSRFHQ